MNPESRSDRDHPTHATRRVAKNTGYLALAEGANKLMLFLFNLIVARHLGVAKFGTLSLALAFVTMFAVLTDLGLGVVTAREIARDPTVARRYVSNVLAVKLLASVVVILLVAALVNLIGFPSSTVRVVYVCSLTVIEGAVTSYYCWVFQGFERMELAALTRIVQAGVLVVGAFLLSRRGAVVENYAFLYVGAGLLSVLFAGIVASVRLVRPGLSIAPKVWWELLRPSLPIGLTVVFTMFYYWNGTTFLSKLQGDAAVGNYTAAYRLATGFVFVGVAFSGAVFPVLSRLFVANLQRLSHAMELALRFVTLLVLPMAVMCAVLAQPITSLVYGSGYEGSAIVLRVVAWWGALACINLLLSNFFLAANRPVVVTIQAGVSLGICVLGNILLIPRLGAVGAAISIVSAEAAGGIFLFVRQLASEGGVPFRRYALVVLRTTAALVPAVAVSHLVARWNLAAGVALGAAVYLTALTVTRGVSRKDVALLRDLVRRNDA